jgi:hypothetical protein
MKKLHIIGISIVLMITLSAGVFADSLLGRDLADQGAKTTVSGSLVYEDGEWYLQSGEDLIQIHLGNQPYLESIGLELKAGEDATVIGFLAGEDIAPITLTVGSDEYRLRDESGFPLWAGAGERRNQQAGGRRGAGRGQASGNFDGSRGGEPRWQSGPGAGNCDCAEEG